MVFQDDDPFNREFVNLAGVRKCFCLRECNPVDEQDPAPPGMMTIPLLIGFQPSQVVQDFIHQPSQTFFFVGLPTRGVPSDASFLKGSQDLQNEDFVVLQGFHI